MTNQRDGHINKSKACVPRSGSQKPAYLKTSTVIARLGNEKGVLESWDKFIRAHLYDHFEGPTVKAVEETIASGPSLRDLAQLLGVSAAELCQFRQRVGGMKLEKVIRIGQSLGIRFGHVVMELEGQQDQALEEALKRAQTIRREAGEEVNLDLQGEVFQIISDLVPELPLVDNDFELSPSNPELASATGVAKRLAEQQFAFSLRLSQAWGQLQAQGQHVSEEELERTARDLSALAEILKPAMALLLTTVTAATTLQAATDRRAMPKGDSVEDHLRLADIYIDEGQRLPQKDSAAYYKFLAAAEELSKAIRLRRTDPNLYLRRARAYYKATSLNLALNDYCSALRLSPSPSVFEERGRCICGIIIHNATDWEFKLGDQALDDFREAIENGTPTYKTYFCRGTCCLCVASFYGYREAHEKELRLMLCALADVIRTFELPPMSFGPDVSLALRRGRCDLQRATVLTQSRNYDRARADIYEAIDNLIDDLPDELRPWWDCCYSRDW